VIRLTDTDEPRRRTVECADRVLMVATGGTSLAPIGRLLCMRGRDVLVPVAVFVLTLAWLVVAWLIARSYGSAG
jgi:hypothetical protein